MFEVVPVGVLPVCDAQQRVGENLLPLVAGNQLVDPRGRHGAEEIPGNGRGDKADCQQHAGHLSPDPARNLEIGEGPVGPGRFVQGLGLAERLDDFAAGSETGLHVGVRGLANYFLDRCRQGGKVQPPFVLHVEQIGHLVSGGKGRLPVRNST